MDGSSQVYLVWLGRYLLINYLSNTITNSNNYININKHRYRIFIDFWGRGWSETVRSVQIKDGCCHGVYLETYSTEFLDGEAPIVAHGRWLVDGSCNTFAEGDDSVPFLFIKLLLIFPRYNFVIFNRISSFSVCPFSALELCGLVLGLGRMG